MKTDSLFDRWFPQLSRRVRDNQAFALLLILVTLANTASAQVFLESVVYVDEISSLNASDLKAVEAFCPPGLTVIGGGASFGSGASVLHVLTLVESRPIDLPEQGWAAVGYETSPMPGDWYLRARAVCAETTGIQRVSVETASNSQNLKNLIAECPSGTVALGGGVRATTSLFPTDLTLQGSLPTTTGDWQGEAGEIVATDVSWELRVDALCGDLKNPSFMTKSRSRLKGSYLKHESNCPTGTYAIGGGTKLRFTSVSAVGTYPFAMQDVSTSSSVAWGTYETLSPMSTYWEVEGTARCTTMLIFGNGFETGDLEGW